VAYYALQENEVSDVVFYVTTAERKMKFLWGWLLYKRNIK
jgi:hypothetical protein